MKCVQCKGHMKKGSTPLHIDRKEPSQNNLSFLSILMSLVNASMDDKLKEKLLVLLSSLENFDLSRTSSYFGTSPKGVHLMLDHVPAWICEQCGESLLEEKEVDAVQDLLRTIDQKSQSFVQTA